MSSRDESPAGLSGYVTVAIPGPGKAGEVQVAIRGGTETFIAYAEAAISRGTMVLVTSHRGGRAVDVIAG